MGHLHRRFDHSSAKQFVIDEERFDTLRRQLYTRTNSETGRTWGRDEPGWDSREVERPKLIETWMERCLRTLSPISIANMSGIWPADVIADLLGSQPAKSNARQAVLPTGGGQVVSLDEWRVREG